MINQIKVTLSIAEFEALMVLAGNELRTPAEQAHMMLRLELERRGLLKAQPNATTVLLEAVFRAGSGEGR